MAYKRRIKITQGQQTTYPLKDKKDMDMIMNYFLVKRDKATTDKKRWQADRNWMICLLGFNTAFRAEDLLQLKVKDVETGFVSIKENKTGKMQHFRFINDLTKDVKEYIERNNLTRNQYLFCGQKDENLPITRVQAYRLMREVAIATNLKSKFSMHTMRKTFGYLYMKKNGSLLTLQKMYNHESPEVTMIYVCWDSNDAEAERMNIYNGAVHRKRIYDRKEK